LDLPYVAVVTKLEMSGDEATLTSETAGGTHNLSVKGQFVLSATKGIAEQRIPNMRGIMSARTKQLQVLEASNVDTPTQVNIFKLPPPKGDCVLVDADNPAELVRLLREEAKII
jgi:electron transfer flavoprotein beta subunit